MFIRVWPDIRFGRIPDINNQAGYPLLSDIQPYFTEVIRPDILQLSFISNKIDIIRPDIRPNRLSGYKGRIDGLIPNVEKRRI